jgi:hypothetical protein
MSRFSDLGVEQRTVLKAKLLTDLAFFIRFFFKVVEGKKYVLNWHHGEIIKRLQGVYEKKIPNLIINIPPRHGKTTIMTFFTAWCLAKNANSLFLYISASEKLINESSRIVRSIVLSHEFQSLFGVMISQDTTAKNHWRTNKNGGITSATINGQITGFGAGQLNDDKEFKGAIIIDDPNKINTDGSVILSEEPNERFEDTIRSRRNGEHTPIIVIQQRCFVNDLSGYLLEGKTGIEFELLKIPVFDQEGQLIWKGKISDVELRTLQLYNDSVFQAQYMQEPTTRKGILFNNSDLKRFEGKLNEGFDNVLAAVDTSNEGADSLCMTVGYVYRNEKNVSVYIDDVIFSNDSISVKQSKCAAMIHEKKINTTLIETNASGVFFLRDLRGMCPAYNIIGRHEYKNKESRIIYQSGFIIVNFFFRSDFAPKSDYHRYYNQLVAYKMNVENQQDDAPDSTASLATLVRQLYQV